MEILYEFPHYSFNQWKNFIELASEMRFTRIDFMQWGCTNHKLAQIEGNFQDEWEAWEKQDKKSSRLPLPSCYKGLKYAEQGWKSQHLFQPFLFPIPEKISG